MRDFGRELSYKELYVHKFSTAKIVNSASLLTTAVKVSIFYFVQY